VPKALYPLWLSGCALLTACASHDYVRDADSIQTEVATGKDAAPVTLPLACDQVGGRELTALREQFTLGNLDLRAAASRLEQAQAAARGSRSALLPRLDLSIQGTRGRSRFGSGNFLFDTGLANQYQASVAASYEVDAWGRVRNNWRAADLDAAATAELTRSLSISLSAQLADAWTALVAQRQLLDLLDVQRDTATRFLELIELRFRLGQATAADVARQRQQVLMISGQRELALARWEALQASVATLLGSHSDNLDLPDTRELPPAQPLAGTVPGNAITGRPDLQAAYLQLRAADARLASATASRLPVLGISGNLNSVEKSAGDLFGETFWQLGLRASQALFDFGQRKANVDVAESRAEQAYYEYAASLVGAVNEVSATLAQAEAQDRYLLALDSQVQEAGRILFLVRDGYRLGQQNFLDVLSAQQALQTLQQAMIEAKRMQLSNRIQLCRAMGMPAGAPATEGQAV